MTEHTETSAQWIIEETGGNLSFVAGTEVMADLGRVAAHKRLQAGLMAAAPDLAEGHPQVADRANSGLGDVAV